MSIIPPFNNYDDLFKYIEKSVHESLIPTADVVLNMVKKFIWENMYEAYSPNYYMRTYEFVNSISIKIKDNKTVEIYYDVKKIHAYEDNNNFWNQHMGWNKKKDGHETYDTSTMIPIWIERGTTGSMWDREPLGAMQSVLNNENNAIQLVLRKLCVYLNKQGYKSAIIG